MSKKISTAWQKKLAKKYGGKKIWLIGGSRGMGLELAKILAHAGADVIISARSDPAHTNFPHRFIPLDVSDLKKLKKTCQAQKNLDGVIYMSGIHKQTLVADLQEKDLCDIVAVNIHAPTLVAKIMTPALNKRGGGFFVVCGSLTSFIGAPLGQPYSATKAYLKNLTESVAFENRNMWVHLLAPGFVRTELVKQITMPMPFTIEPEEAAFEFAKRIMGPKLVIEFPFIITLFPKLWRVTPLFVKKAMWLMTRKNFLTQKH
ncbi:MAG: SDR family NAD(P)-dependent oxidoreductase [Hydrotalea sp.]|nr:SDR family NAD(P)-dependent oxidoreductase [Hydrotalea sp.]